MANSFDSIDCSTPCSSVFQYLPSLFKFMSIESVILSNHLILCCPLLLPSIFHSMWVFPNESVFTSGGWSIRAPASVSVLPMNIQSWFPLGLTGLISLQSKGFSRVFSNTTIWKHQFFSTQPSLWTNSHIHTWLLEIKLRFSNWGKTGEWTSEQGTNTLLPYLYIHCYSNKTYFHFYISVQQNFLS